MRIQWKKDGNITCVKQFDENADVIVDEEMYGINEGDVDDVDVVGTDEKTGFVDLQFGDGSVCFGVDPNYFMTVPNEHYIIQYACADDVERQFNEIHEFPSKTPLADENWSYCAAGETAEEALRNLLEEMNNEDISTNNTWFRIVKDGRLI